MGHAPRSPSSNELYPISRRTRLYFSHNSSCKGTRATPPFILPPSCRNRKKQLANDGASRQQTCCSAAYCSHHRLC
jgi:hypothetical protein